VALWYLGQSGFAVKGSNGTVYFDPYLSDFLERYTKGRPDEDPRHFHPPLVATDVTNADLIFGSHYHYDHIDPGAALPISKASPQCRFVVPAVAKTPLLEIGVAEAQIEAVPVDESLTVAGVTFVSIPAAHETLDYDPEFGYPYRGYVVTLGDVKIYHAGDCVPYDGLVERLASLKVDIALVPINGRDYFRLRRGFAGNFTYREAAELAVAIGADLLVPMHFGMHMANTQRPGYLVDFLVDQFPQQKFHVMVPGERMIYLKVVQDGLAVITP
jgi:L-ascorbate metabolism protein UlaG (beta-lactamase superfamily)